MKVENTDLQNDQPARDRAAARVSWWPAVISVLGLCLLAMVWGGLAVCHGFFPGRMLRNAYQGAMALKTRMEFDRMEFSVDLWSTNRFGQVTGVTRSDPARAFPGYTLYTSGHTQGALLVDLAGTVVHAWNLPYDRIWDASAVVQHPRPAHQIFWFKAHLFPNGDLLAVVEGNGSTPWGQGIIRIDRDSRLVWKFLDHAHHDFSIGADGRIYALTHRIRTEPLPGLAIQPPCLEDFIVVLSPEGKKLVEVSLFEAIRDSAFRHQFDNGSIKSDHGEYLHANAARVVTAAMARRLPFARAGQVCVSMPAHQSSLALVDLDKRRVEWLKVGSWRFQHDPDFLEDGRLLLFDNWGHTDPGGHSRVIEYDPATEAVVWSYAGQPDDIMQSGSRSGQQRLPNGNTLITESDAGRMIEVTPDKKVVWEFINPARGGKHGELIAVISTGERIAPSTLDAPFRDYLAAKGAPPTPPPPHSQIPLQGAAR